MQQPFIILVYENGTWTATSDENFLTLARGFGDNVICSSSACSGGIADNDLRLAQLIITASGNGSDRRTANVTITVMRSDVTATGSDTVLSVEGVVTFIQRGETRLNITSDLDTLASGDGSTSAISFTTNGTWEAMSSETFITLSPTTGTGDATITAMADENTTGALRTATISITSVGIDGMNTKTTTVSQAAMSAVAPPELAITPDLDTLAHDNESTITIGFSTNANWEAESDQDFITLSPANGGASDAAEVTATAASANTTGSLRTATITITATGADGTTSIETVMLSQDEAPTITNISSSARVIFPNPGANTHDLEDFMVGGSATGWTSTITYDPTVASGGESFVTLTPDAGPRGADISVMAALDENTTSSQREALITVTTTGRGTPVSNSFTIQQAAAAPAAAPTLTLTPPHTDGDVIRIDHTNNNSGDGLPTIAFNVGGGATGWTHAITGDDFITLGGDTTNATTTTGDVTVTATPTANTDMDAVERSATIRITTIGGAGDSATFAVTITQSASSFGFTLDRPTGGITMNSDGSFQVAISSGIPSGGIVTAGAAQPPIRFSVIPSTADVTFTHSHFIVIDTLSSADSIPVPGSGTLKNYERSFDVNYVIAANNTGASRDGSITFTVRSPVGSQTFTVTFTQGVAPLPSAGFGEITIQTGDFSLDAIRDPNVGVIATFLGLPTSTTTLPSIGLSGTDITDLDSLIFLQSLTGHLIIDGTNITSLRGLDNLTRIDGNLIIQNNSMLTSLEGLGALTNVGRHVIIRDNGVLTSLAGLAALTSIGGDVTIVDNENLTLCCESVTLAAAINTVRIRDGEIGFHTTISGNGSNNCNDVNELVGCSGTLPQAPEPMLTLTSAAMDTLAHDDASTSSIVFNVADATWTAESDQGFVTLDPSTNDNAAGDNLMLTATASANGTGMLRTATITITATGGAGTTPVTRTVMISQDEAPTITNISSSARVIFPNPGANTHDLEDFMVGGSATGWTSTITYDPTVASGGESFVTLTPDAGPRGADISVMAALDENTTSSQREALITVTTTGRGTPVSNSFTIQQAAAAPAAAPTLTLTPPHTDGDVIRIDHTTDDVQTIEFNVGGGATGWTHAITGDDFITLGGDITNTTTTTGDVTVTATPTANTDMDAVERSATIRITTIGGAGDSATFAVTITQSASSFDFRVDRPSGATMNSDGSFQVATSSGIPSGGIVTAGAAQPPIRFSVIPSTADVTFTHSHFIVIDTLSSADSIPVPGSGTLKNYERSFDVNYVVAANNTGDARDGSITFTVRSPVGSQTFTVTLVQAPVAIPTAGFGEITTQTGDFSLDAIRDPDVGHIAVFLGLPTSTTTLPSIGLSSTDITDLDSLIFLQSLTEHLIIDGTNITSLRGLDNLTRIDGNLIIQNNSMLTSLEGLEALTNVGGHVIIRGNGVLTSLAGLSALGTIGGDVTIQANASLTLCCGSATLAGAIDAVRIRDGEIGLHTTISGNGSDNCSDVNELVGCSGTLPQSPEPMLTLTSSNVDTLAHDDASTSSIVFNVADATWTAESDQSFVTLDPSTNDNAAGDNLMLTATASANTTGSLRTATITITATGADGTTTLTETVMLSQDEVPTITNISSSARVIFQTEANTHDLEDFMVGGSATGWTSTITYMPTVASGGEAFVTLTPAAGPRGTNMSVTAAADENTTSSQREALITVTTTGRGTPVSNSFTIQQAAAPADPPTLTLTPPHTDGDIIRIDHTTDDVQTIEFNVGGGATGWTSAITGDDFITLGGDTTNATTTTGDVTVTATPTANTDMDAEERSATIRITTIGGAGDPVTFAVTITQSASSFGFTLDRPTGGITMNSDGSLQVDTSVPSDGVMTTNDPIQFSVTPSTADVTFSNDILTNHFIGVDTVSSLIGVDTVSSLGDDDDERAFNVNYVIAANNTGDARDGTITFTVRSPVGSQKFTVTFTQAPVAIPSAGFGEITTQTGDFSLNTIRDPDVGVIASFLGLPTSATALPSIGLSGTDITDLDSLIFLQSLTGHLIIDGTNITSLRGLDNLTRIDGNLVIINNSMLTSLEGLEALTNVGGHVIIRDNGVLTSLAGLAALGTIGGDVTIVDNGMLTLCCGSRPLATAIQTVRSRTVPQRLSTAIFGNGSDNCGIGNIIRFLNVPCPPAPDLYIVNSDDEVEIPANNIEAIEIQVSDNTVEDIDGNPDGLVDATGWVATIAYMPEGADFIDFTPEMGGSFVDDIIFEDGYFVITATPNSMNTGVERTAIITITTTGSSDPSSVTFTITQRGAAPVLTFTPVDETIAYDAESANDITFNVGGGATGWISNIVYTPDGADFITLDPDNGGRGDVTVGVVSAVNTGVERSAEITITTVGGTGAAATATVTITQSAAPAVPTLTVTSNTGTLAHGAGSTSVIEFNVANATWTAESSETFVTLDSTSGNAGDNLTITTTAEANTTGSARTATITITATDGTITLTETVTLTQSAAPAPDAHTLLLISDSIVYLAHDVVVEQTIRFTVGGSASGWTSEIAGDNFITLTDDGATTGDVVVTATPSGANTGVARSVMITFTTEGGTGAAATATVTIRQAAAPPTLVLSSPSTVTLVYDEVSAQTIMFSIGGGATGWTASVDENFVTLNPSMGGETDSVRMSVYLTENIGAERTATITILTTGDGTPVSQMVTIRQEALPDYIHVGDVFLTTQAQVDTIRNTLGDPRITAIGGNLIIGPSTDINNLDSLRFLTEITGNFEIGQNGMTNGVPNGNSALVDIGDFPFLQKIGGGYYVIQNTNLVNGGNFPVLDSVGGYFFIRSNDKLESVGNFPRLKGIGTYVSIRSNDNLRSLYEFPALTSIGTGNPYVPSESDITANTSIVVEDNPLLEYCCVLTRFREGGGIILGRTYVNNNFEGCNISDDGDETNCNLSVRLSVDDTVRLPFFSEETDFTLYSNTRWQLSKLNPGDADWVTSLSSGVGEGVADNLVGARDTRIRVNHTPNPNSESRMAQLLISFLDTMGVATPADTLTLIQSAAPPTLVVATNDTTIDHNSGDFSISFSLGGTAVGWEAEITGDAFITLDPAGPNTTATGETVTITAMYEANMGAERMATITFTTTGGATDMVTITQSAEPAPMDHKLLLTSASTVDLAHDATTAEDITFIVGGSATGWVTSSDQSFVTLIPTSGGVGTWELAIFFTENIGVARAATITITTTGATGAPVSKTIMITQAAAPPVLVLTSGNTVDVLNTETDPSDSIEIMFVVGGGATGWEATVDEGFVTLDKTMGSSGTDTLKVAVTENVGVERSAVITLTTMGGTGSPASATVTIRQEAAPAVPTLTVISNTGTLAHGAGSTFDIVFNVANAMWTAVSDQSYVTVSPESGTAGDNLTVTTTAEANTTGLARTATITITATDGTITLTETVTLTQSAAPPPPSLLLFTPSTVTLAHDSTTAENITFIVGGSAGGWTAMSSNTNFVTVSPSLGTGETGVIMVTVVGTSAGSRTSDIEITTTGSIGTAVTETVTITQEAVPTLSVDPSSFTLGHDVVDAQNIVVTSGGSATSWTASSDSAFVTFTTSSGVSGDSATFTLSSNGTGSERASEIVITTEGSLGTAVTETVTITQEEAPTLSVDNSSFTLGHDVVGEQNIMVSVGGSAASWNATSDGAFVTITTSNGGNGDNVTFTLSSNNTGSERTAEIVITTVGSLGNDSTVTVMITQEAAPTLSVDNSSFTLGHDEGDAQNIVVTSGGSATGWTASSDSTFVVFTTSSGVSGGSATFTLSSNDTGSERAAEIVITTEGSLGTAVTETVTITQEESPTLMLSTPTTVGIDYNVTAAQTITFDVGGSATGWDSDTVYSPVGTGFITLTLPMNNAETGTVTVEAKPTENTGAARSVTITFYTTGQLGDSVTAQVTITQGAAPNSPMLMGLSFRSGDTVSIEHNDSTTVTNIGFTAGGNATGWTASSDNSFVTLSSMSGNSTDPVMLMATLTGMNRGVERSATITISTSGPGTSPATATLTITQGGAPPMLSVSTMAVDTIGHDEVTSDITFTVGGGAMGWTASSDQTFVTLSPTEGNSGADIDVTATFVDANITGVARTATITITTMGGAGVAETRMVTLTQEAAPVLTLITPTDTVKLLNGATTVGNITFTLEGSATGWTAMSSNTNFVTVPLAGTTEREIMVTVVGTSTEFRTSDITITTTGRGTPISRTVTITQAAGLPTIMLTSGNSVNVAYTSDSIEIMFVVGGGATGWEATVDEDFVTLDTTMGSSGSDTLKVAVTENGGVERSATITFTTSGGTGTADTTITITQGGAPPTLMLSRTSASVDATAQTLTVSVTLGGSAESWGVTETDVNNFITTSKVGNDSLRITILENLTTASREATLTFTTIGAAPQTLVITQAGGVPTLSITGETSLAVDSAAGTANIEIMSNTNWRVTTAELFVDSLIFTPTEGSVVAVPVSNNITLEGTGSGTLSVVYKANTEAARVADITLTRTGGTDIDITLMQAAGLPTIMLTSGNTVDVANTATTSSDSIAIMFVVGGGATGWTAAVDADFVTLGKTMGSSGSATLKAAVKENTGVELTAIITLTATTEGTEKAETTIMIKQGGAPPTLEVSIPTPKSGSDTTIAYDATTLNVMFTVGGGATGWEATVIDGDANTNDFVTLSKSSGSAGLDTIKVTTTENTGEARMDTVVITTVGGFGASLKDTVVITQEAALPDYIYTGDITVTTQAEVDTLNTTLAGKTRINGSLTIGNNTWPGGRTSFDNIPKTDVMNLSALSNITEVTGDVVIVRTQLQNLDGLIQLRIIGGSFRVGRSTLSLYGADISGSSAIKVLGDFTALDSIGGDFEVYQNMSLETLGNFPSLVSIGGDFSVHQNHSLEMLGNLSALQIIRGSFRIGIRLYSLGNRALQTLGYFTSLNSIGGHFEVHDNDNLISLGDFPALSSIGTADNRVFINSLNGYSNNVSIVVEVNSSLSDCSVLIDFLPGGTHAVSGEIYINDNAVGCNSGDEIKAAPHTIMLTSHTDGDSIAIAYNEVTTQTIMFSIGGGATGWTSDITGDDFITLDTDMNVAQDTGVAIMVRATPTENTDNEERTATITLRTTGQGIPASAVFTIIQKIQDTTYTGDITVTTQAEVDFLRTTLAGKTRIDGNLTIGYNDFGDSRSNITDLTPLSNITDIIGNLIIEKNGQLVNLNDLNNLQSIGGNFWVRQNYNLSTLGVFPALQSIGGGFIVSSNANLAALGDFSALQTIGERFVMTDTKLTTLGDFSALQTIGGVFSVSSNSELTTIGNFPALQTIGEHFSVFFNDKLLSLGSFPNLTSVGITAFSVYVPSLGYRNNVSIVVEDNINLVLCSWLEEFLPNGTHAVTGDIYIQNNATGCETTEEINNPSPVLVVENPIFAHTDSTTTSFNIYANVRWQLATSDDATWITSLSSDSSTHTSRITGENEATITLTHTRAPDETPRSTTLTLTAIDENGNELTNPASITIHFTQLSTFYKGDIILSSQEEVDEFISNTTVILGNLTIGYTDFSDSRSDITDLTSLSNVTHITGNLRIQQNGQLVNLNALNNLQSIGGYFRVTVNDQLTILGNFSELQSIGEFFSVSNNDQLTTLGDFPELQSIRDFVAVFDNDRLTTFGDFPELQSVGGDFGVSSTRLTKLGDFPALQTIGEDFRVFRNPDLTTFGDFPALQTIGEDFSVSNNDQLITLGNFSNLQTIGGYFRMQRNDQLTTFGDFTALQTIGGYFDVSHNDRLTTLGDFPDLQSIGEHLNIRDNDKLTTLGNFSTLTSIGIGDTVYIPSLRVDRNNVSIVVEDNINLVLCSWLEEFFPDGNHAVTGDIYINNNATGCATTEEIKNPPPVLVAENRIFSHKDSTTTSFNVYSNVRWQLVTSDDATWISSLSSDSSTHSSRITGENESTITLMHTRAPSETSRSTTLTLTAIDEDGEELTNPTSITIHFTQLSIFYEGNITLRSQAEVNEFISNTTVILGTLTIGYTDGNSQSNITDLGPLSNITDITGNLRIQQNGQLDNLNALNNLQTVGGRFWVRNNDQLTTLGNFSALDSIGGNFLVSENPDLSILGDFPVLQIIGGYFWVENNGKLTDLGKFPALQSIRRIFQVYDNVQLTTLGNFSNLQSIGGYFSVNNNDTLTTLGDFPVLQTIGGNFNVHSNDSLTDLGDFPILQTIGGNFNVYSNDSLTDLGDFPILQTIGGNFNLQYNAKLTDLGDFPVLQSIGGLFYVINNAKLTALGDFPSLRTVGEYFNVYNNAQLAALGDFPVLQTIGGNFRVNGNDQLTTLGDFPVLQTIGGNFRVQNNDSLTALGNFSALTSIGVGGTNRGSNVSIQVEGNSSLSDCSVLIDFLPGGDHAVSGEIYINNNATEGDCNSPSDIIAAAPIIMLTSHTDGDSIAIAYNEVTEQTITFDVGGSATGWIATSDQDFITLVPSVGDSGRNIEVVATPTGENTGVERSAVITIMTRGGTGAPATATVMITQDGTPPTLRLISKNRETLAYDETTETAIMFEVGGGATGWRSSIAYTPSVESGFITLNHSSSGSFGATATGTVAIRATPMDNMGVERTAVITLTTMGGTGVATNIIIITQESVPTIALSTSHDIHIAYNEVSAQLLTFSMWAGVRRVG